MWWLLGTAACVNPGMLGFLEVKAGDVMCVMTPMLQAQWIMVKSPITVKSG